MSQNQKLSVPQQIEEELGWMIKAVLAQEWKKAVRQFEEMCRLAALVQKNMRFSELLMGWTKFIRCAEKIATSFADIVQFLLEIEAQNGAILSHIENEDEARASIAVERLHNLHDILSQFVKPIISSSTELCMIKNDLKYKMENLWEQQIIQ